MVNWSEIVGGTQAGASMGGPSLLSPISAPFDGCVHAVALASGPSLLSLAAARVGIVGVAVPLAGCIVAMALASGPSLLSLAEARGGIIVVAGPLGPKKMSLNSPEKDGVAGPASA